MFCLKCGTELPDDSRFCNKCGYAVTVRTNAPEPQLHVVQEEPTPPSDNATVSADPKQKEFCSRCGMAFVGEETFCTACGERRVIMVEQNAQPPVYQQLEPTRQQSGSLGTNVLATVPYKGSGESVRFFDDHVEFGEHRFSYTDISVMDTHAVESTGYAAIVFYGSFDGFIRFTLFNGQKIKIKVYGFSVYGIGTKGGAKRRFPPLFSAAYKIVAKAMASNALAQIQRGLTVNIAGMEITREGAHYKRMLKKEPVFVSKHNFGACGLDGYKVRVVDKNGGTLLAMPDDAANALLLPYVLTSLFGN